MLVCLESCSGGGGGGGGGGKPPPPPPPVRDHCILRERQRQFKHKKMCTERPGHLPVTSEVTSDEEDEENKEKDDETEADTRESINTGNAFRVILFPQSNRTTAVLLSWGCAQLQGKRSHMEDRICVQLHVDDRKNSPSTGMIPLSVFAVFDGHGGSLASDFLQRHLLERIRTLYHDAHHPQQDTVQHTPPLVAQYTAPVTAQHTQRDSSQHTHQGFVPFPTKIANNSTPVRQSASSWLQRSKTVDLRALVRLAVEQCCAEFHRRYPRAGFFQGSTIALALLHGSTVWLCNVGDSRVLFAPGRDSSGSPSSRNTESLLSTVDHSPDRNDESARIRRAGGVVRLRRGRTTRVYDARGRGGLAMSRAFGDLFYKHSNWFRPDSECLRKAVLPAAPAPAPVRWVSTPSCTTRTAAHLVTADPDFYSGQILLPPSGQCSAASVPLLILASDGLWDSLSNREAVAFVRGGLQRGSVDCCMLT
mmetsp:Transcript_24055/g.60220  ORF Transcript_24055/g.60220 Transcript_24055/m.60220 type:complete len:477 (-) Transcript_24055:292-1722(-)